MKRRTVTGTAALLLAAALTFTGCGQGSQTSSAASAAQTETAAASEEAAESSAESAADESVSPETDSADAADASALSPELDEAVTAFLEAAQALKGSPEENLETAYRYLLTQSKYLGVGTPDFAEGWKDQYALDMLDMTKGNCFSYASTFAVIASKLGFSPVITAGTCTWGEEELAEHCWVLIDEKVYDPLLEDRLDDGVGDLHFFATDYDSLSADQNCTYIAADTY